MLRAFTFKATVLLCGEIGFYGEGNLHKNVWSGAGPHSERLIASMDIVGLSAFVEYAYDTNAISASVWGHPAGIRFYTVNPNRGGSGASQEIRFPVSGWGNSSSRECSIILPPFAAKPCFPP